MCGACKKVNDVVALVKLSLVFNGRWHGVIWLRARSNGIIAKIGESDHPRPEQKAAYIKNWLGALESDVKFVFWASRQAMKAKQFIKDAVARSVAST